MNICFFTTNYTPAVGGITAHSVRLSDALARAEGIESVQVIALKNRFADERTDGTLSVIRRTDTSLARMFFDVARFAWRFRSYDVFHATSVFPIGFFVLLVGKYLLRKPVVTTFYGTDVLTSDGSHMTKWAKGFTLRHATAAIAFSYSTRDLAAKKYGVPPESFPVIYTFLDEQRDESHRDEVRARYGIKPDDFLVLFVGYLVKRKGAELLVRALGKIKDEGVKLIIVGDGSERPRIEQAIVEEGLDGRVHLAGKVSGAPYYSAADVFSMPSFFDRDSDDIEGLGIVYLEAQAAGIPVIGTRSGGIPEALEDGKTGFLADELDVQGIADAIVRLKSDPELRKRMGERGPQFVREKFSREASVRNHSALYDRCRAASLPQPRESR